VDPKVEEEISKAPDRSAAISENAKGVRSVVSKTTEIGAVQSSKGDELCLMAVDLFVSCYGAEAGNLALKTLPFSGLYICGNIASKLRWALERNNNFLENFWKKGRLSHQLHNTPVYLVTETQIGVLGAKVLCRRLLRREATTSLHDHNASSGVRRSHSTALNSSCTALQFSVPVLLASVALAIFVFIRRNRS